MAPFTTAQSQWFHGRRELVDEIVDKLADLTRSGGLLMVVAPSGAGKSSLLAAGLLPALAGNRLAGSGRWVRLLLHPGVDPLDELIGQLGRATQVEKSDLTVAVARGPQHGVDLLRSASQADRTDPRMVVVIDQFEEMFTLGPQTAQDEVRRRQFVELLACLAEGQPGQRPPLGLVVCALRSDFYTRCSSYSRLRSALQENQIFLGPMSEKELRSAIEDPALDVGLRVEPGLTELLIEDFGVSPAPDDIQNNDTQDVYEAGRLPLLAFVLPKLWRRRDGSRLTVESYTATGGIAGAVNKAAEGLFRGFDAEDQRITKIILLRLVKISGGGRAEDVQRRRAYGDLVDGLDPKRASRVVDALIDARLLTREQDTVQITHNALLRAWGRLYDWTKTDRPGNVIRQELEDNAEAWRRASRDNSMVYQGIRLDLAQEWAKDASHASALPPVALEFLAASARQQTRTARRRRLLIAVLATLTLLASAAAGYAFQQRSVAQSELSDVSFHQVTSEADALRAGSPRLAAALDLVAEQMRPSDQTLRRTLTYDDNVPDTISSGGLSFAISHNGRMLAASGASTSAGPPWTLLDISHPSQPRTIADIGPIPHADIIDGFAFSADDRVIAADVSADVVSASTVVLWNIANPAHPVLMSQIPVQGNSSIEFSPRGRVLLIDANGTLPDGTSTAATSLWNVADPAHPVEIGGAPGQDNTIAAYAFSPDSETLATGTNGELSLWNVTDPAHPTLRGSSPLVNWHSSQISEALQAGVMSLVFSPNGRLLATADLGGDVRLWNVADPAKPVPVTDIATTTGLDGSNTPEFSADSSTLAIGNDRGTLVLWDISDSAHPVVLGQPGVSGLSAARAAFSPDSPDLFVPGALGLNRWHYGPIDQTVQQICTADKALITPAMWNEYVGPAIAFSPPCN